MPLHIHAAGSAYFHFTLYFPCIKTNKHLHSKLLPSNDLNHLKNLNHSWVKRILKGTMKYQSMALDQPQTILASDACYFDASFS